MSTMFVTITGIHHYYGDKPFEIGRVVRLVKEPDNKHDNDAIRVELPFIETVGCVANSTSTVYRGTYSAGRIYDKIEDAAFAEMPTNDTDDEEDVIKFKKKFKIGF